MNTQKTNVQHIFALIFSWLTISPLFLHLALKWKSMKKGWAITFMLVSPLFLIIYASLALMIFVLLYLNTDFGKAGYGDKRYFTNEDRIERITGMKFDFGEVLEFTPGESSFNGDYSCHIKVALDEAPDYAILDSICASNKHWLVGTDGYHFSIIWGNGEPAPKGEDPNEDRLLDIFVPTSEENVVYIQSGMW